MIAATRHRWLNRLRKRVHGQPLPVWYAPEYRPPLTATSHTSGFEPRRADLALWYLLDAGVLTADELHTPVLATWQDVARVHSAELIEALTGPDLLASIYHAQPAEMPVDEMLTTLRLATGGTIAAARFALEHGGPTLNLLGGFHHAAPDAAGGLCAINDVAIAVAALRSDGFDGRVRVLDVDAHPPDGCAACLAGDSRVWIGSLSGSDWGVMDGVDETVLSDGCGDEDYAVALRELLDRMPAGELTFVLAGGDVLADDPLGALGLTVQGVAARDLTIAQHLDDDAAVWLPAGGYTDNAWRVLAGSAWALALGSKPQISGRTDPLTTRFAGLAEQLDGLDGGSDEWLTSDDLAGLFGPPGAQTSPRLLGFYSASAIEVALHHYGILAHVRRLGYHELAVELQTDAAGDIFRLRGRAAGRDHVLVEASLGRDHVDGVEVLYVNWLSLRHPLATFGDERPQLPGQDVPGLGMAREASVLLGRMAERLHLVGVAFRPASYHVAFAAKQHCAFADPQRQGRFVALLAALAERPLIDATSAVAEGRVRLNGEPYAWEADMMVRWLRPHERQSEQVVAASAAACRYEVVPAAGAGPV